MEKCFCWRRDMTCWWRVFLMLCFNELCVMKRGLGEAFALIGMERKLLEWSGSNEDMLKFHELCMRQWRKDEDCESSLHMNGELGGVWFLVEVRPTTKGFSKSFSREENSKKSLTSTENSTTFHYFNEANLNIVHLFIWGKRRKSL